MPKILDDTRDELKRGLGNKIREMQEHDPDALADYLGQLTDDEAYEIMYDDEIMLRDKQWIRLDSKEEITLLMAGRGFGKLMCRETPLLTLERGFIPLGEVEVGEHVYDEQGNPTEVLAVHDNMPEKAYRVHFSDKTSVDACSDHLWNTWEHRDRKAYLRSTKTEEYNAVPSDWVNWRGVDRYGRPTGTGPSVKTTQDIVDTFYYGKRKARNHSIPVTKPINFPEKDLVVDPYLLGYWLGDGGRKTGIITVHPEDQPSLEKKIKGCGYELGDNKCYKNISILGLRKDLRICSKELFSDKTIPDAYLYSSVEQRLEFLRGIMDSDGYCNPTGNSVEFCAERKEHAEAVYFLASSLGYKPVMSEGEATLDGCSYGTNYRVIWNPSESYNPFYLERKASLVKNIVSQGFRNTHRMLTRFEEIEPKPMRCLTVDSPSRLFLVGKNLIPTHNTHAAAATAKRAIERHGLKHIMYIAPTARTLNKSIAPAIISRYPDDHPNKPELKQGFIKFPNGAEIQLIPAEAGEDAPRSANVELLILEEAAFYGNNEGIITQAELTCRLEPAKTIVVTTPKATTAIIDWVNRVEANDPTIKLINGSTAENQMNLSEKFVRTVYDKYKGTRLEDTELKGILILENEDALFNIADIRESEVEAHELPEMVEYAIGVDIALISKNGGAGRTKNSRKPDSTGIIISGKGTDGKIYGAIENHSGRYSPEKWATRVALLYDQYRERGKTNLVFEINQAGLEMIQMAFRQIKRDDIASKVKPYFSSVSKMARAQPYALMHEQGKIHFLKSKKNETLYKELTTYTGVGKSPDEMDALVFSFIGVDPLKKSYTTVHELIM